MIPAITHKDILNRLPKYTSSDNYLFWTVVPVLTVLLNISMFSYRYFFDLRVLIVSSLVILTAMTILWFLLNAVAVLTRKHFAGDPFPFKRMATTIFLYIIITALFTTLIHWLYESTGLLGFSFNEKRYSWSIIIGVILNIFITLLHEGIAGFENWKATMIETEQLKKEYMQSQLLGLKSQVNPHFLFNSLNSLSSLISEDQEEAEKFLDEMSKVYRYLLRNSDDQLVTLETELQFVNSYFYLLKSRHSDGIHLVPEISDEDFGKMLPPLSLQVLVESAYNQNTVNKDRPVTISITSLNNGWIRITNNIEKKLATDQPDDAGLENIANKFRLLCQQNIVVNRTDEFNMIELPLITDLPKPLV